MTTFVRQNFPAPLTTIVADPDWRRLTKEERRQIRSIHARKLRLARMRLALKR